MQILYIKCAGAYYVACNQCKLRLSQLNVDNGVCESNNCRYMFKLVLTGAYTLI
jgi:hypothetical protein